MGKKLIGFVRKSAKGDVWRVNINKRLFEEVDTYLSNKGEEYVSLLIDVDNTRDIEAGYREYALIYVPKEDEE